MIMVLHGHLNHHNSSSSSSNSTTAMFTITLLPINTMLFRISEESPLMVKVVVDTVVVPTTLMLAMLGTLGIVTIPMEMVDSLYRLWHSLLQG
jgi:hypothetical protein